MIKGKQRGDKTYIRDMVTSIFEGYYLEKPLSGEW